VAISNITKLDDPTRVAICNADPTRSAGIVLFWWSQIGTMSIYRKIVRSYDATRDFDYHGLESHSYFESHPFLDHDLFHTLDQQHHKPCSQIYWGVLPVYWKSQDWYLSICLESFLIKMNFNFFKIDEL